MPVSDRAQVERWVRRDLDHQDRHGYGLFSVVLQETGLLIGDRELERMYAGGKTQVELGDDLRNDQWNRELGTEAATAERCQAFGVLEVPRLISLIGRGNEALRRVAEKVGMRLEEDVERTGHRYWLYSLARDEAPP